MDCGSLSANLSTQNQQYAGADPGIYNYLTSTNIKCVVGYTWADGDADGLKSITCQANGIWSAAGSTCVRMYFL